VCTEIKFTKMVIDKWHEEAEEKIKSTQVTAHITI
jgi:hypothetical protein